VTIKLDVIKLLVKYPVEQEEYDRERFFKHKKRKYKPDEVEAWKAYKKQ
jgi:hypothetical protein